MASKFPSQCPSCNHHLTITQLYCEQCGTNLTGSFDSLFEILTDEEQLFVKEFVLNSGSLKLMAQQMNKSYPTIRKMLDQIINKLD